MKNLFFLLFSLFYASLDAQSLTIYKGGQGIITGTWNEAAGIGSTDTLYETSEAQPYEGDMHYRFDYSYTEQWAGVGLNLNNWGATEPYNFQPYTHLRIAYKGLSPNEKLGVRFYHIDKESNTTIVGGSSNEYDVIDVPLMLLFAGSYVLPTAVSEIDLVILTDSAVGSGTVYFDAVELINKPDPLNPSKASAATKLRAKSMKKGVNCSNWLEAYWLLQPPSTYPQVNRFTREKIAALRFAGFDSFRLPVCFEQLASPVEPYTINFDQTAFDLIDSMILWAQEMDFKLVIDNHHGFVLNDDTYLGEQERIKAIWRQLIIKYDYLNPNRYFFELYNEPTAGISNDNFRALSQYVLDEVRGIEKQRHTFIIGAKTQYSPKELLSFTPLVDSNIIYTFHTYEPFAFTKQGFSWTNPPFLPTRGFPEFDDIERLYQIFEGAQYWADYHKVPVSLGEFGSSFAADSVSRCAYIYTIAGHIFNNDMGYFYWDATEFYDAFGYYNGEVVTLDSVWYCFKDALQLYGMVTINDLTQDHQMSLNVAPNPTTGITYLRLEGELKQLRRYVIYDHTGREVYAQQIEEDGNEAIISLQLDAYTKGLYRLVLYADNGKTWHRNIIVQ